MILPQQTLIRTGALAKELGIHVTTLCRWTQVPGPWRDAMQRRGWYSVARLRVAGLLAPDTSEPSDIGVCVDLG